MDASNEFKVYLSRDGQERMKNRSVPVINKVFSPSHFLLAQRKTSLYKAMSGVSFQDAEDKNRKTSSGGKDNRKKNARSSSSEREKSYINYKNGRANLSSSSLNTNQSSQEYKSYDGLRHYRGGTPDKVAPHHPESHRLQRGSSKERQSRRQRTSLDSSGYNDRSPSYEKENGDRTRHSSSKDRQSRKHRNSLENSGYYDRSPSNEQDNSTRLRRSSSKETKHGQRSCLSSAVRSRSVSATDNMKIVYQNTVVSSDEQPPVRPPRTRSTSRTRHPVVKSSSASAVIMTGVDRGRMTEDVIKSYKERHKTDAPVLNQNFSDITKDENNSETDIELRSGSRSRKRTDKSLNEEENSSRSRSRSRSVKVKDTKIKNKKDEPEGGYFSMEKVALNETTSNLIEDYLENEKCIESIYVCSAISKQPLHSNKLFNAQQAIHNLSPNVKENEVNSIIQRVKESQSMLFKCPRRSLNENCSTLDQNDQNIINYQKLSKTTSTPSCTSELGYKECISYIDDDDISDDETFTSYILDNIKPVTGNTNISDNGPALSERISQQTKLEVEKIEKFSKSDLNKTEVLMRPSFDKLQTKKISPRYSCPVNFDGISRDYEGNWSQITSFSNEDNEKTSSDIKSNKEKHNNHSSKTNNQFISISDNEMENVGDFEPFSDSESELTDINYDLFKPRSIRRSRLKRDQQESKSVIPPLPKNKHRQNAKNQNKSPVNIESRYMKEKCLQSSQTETNMLDREEKTKTQIVTRAVEDTKTPKTFRELLKDKKLNPVVDSDSLLNETRNEKPIKHSKELIARGPREVVLSKISKHEKNESVTCDENQTLCWSDAESEFEFVNFTNLEPMKEFLRREINMSSSVTSMAKKTTSFAEDTVYTSPEGGHSEASIKRSQSMKAVSTWRKGEFDTGGLSRHGVPTRRSVREDSRQKRNKDSDNNDVSSTSTINSGQHSSQEGGQQKQQHLQEQITKQTGNNYTPTKIANLLSRKLTKITKSPKLEKEKNKITNNDVEKSTEGSSASSSSHNTPVGTPHDTPTATPPNHRHLRQRVQIKINRDDSRRTENILKIWILEVKGVPPKKKYYCNIVVDGQLCHSTVAKQKTNMCFWGQDFHISLDSQDSIVHVELMRGIDKGRTKLVGRITIPLKTTSKGEALLTGLVEQWYPITCDKQEKDAPQLRIKHKFQSLTVLPLVNYARLREYLSKQSTSLCQVLEHNLSVKAKEDLAHALVHITHAEGFINNFLVTLIINDIDRIESEQCLFRGNSVATKAIEAYMRLVGEQYLQETLSSVVQKIISATEDMEVDPMRITNLANLPVIIKQQQSTLRLCVEEVWEHILQSADNFPVELRKVFHTLRQRLIHHKEKLEHTDNLISACVFLRFICPAILSPSLFDIVQEYPEERTGRHLTLVAKTIQTLANFTWFHRKENYMEFLNDFIAQEQTNCRNFLRKVSSYDTNVGSHLEFVGDIDLGLNLALLHVHLAEAMPNLLIKDNAMDTRKMALLVREISSQINPSSVPLMENIYNSTVDASHRYILNKDLTENNQKQTDNDSTVQTVVGSESKSVDSKSVDSKGVDSNSLQNSCIQQQIDEYTQAAQEITLLASNMEQGQNNICNNRYGNASGNDNPLDTRNLSSFPKDASLRLQSPFQEQKMNQEATYNSGTYQSQSDSVSSGNPPNDYSEFYNSMDSWSLQIRNLCIDGNGSHTNSQGSQTSISQLSNNASSGYQSISFSQSSSPVDSALHMDKIVTQQDNKLLKASDARRVQTDALPGVQSPVQMRNSNNRMSSQRQLRRISLQLSPKQIKHSDAKGSVSSSPSSSRSTEDLQLRPASDSSDYENNYSPNARKLPPQRLTKSSSSSARIMFSISSPQEGKERQIQNNKRVTRKARRHRSCEREERPRYAGNESGERSANQATANDTVEIITNIHHQLVSPTELEKDIAKDKDGSQNILEAQEHQMKEIIERLMCMETDFRTEQEAMRSELQKKEARINAQAQKIAELDCSNNKMIRTIAYISNNNS